MLKQLLSLPCILSFFEFLKHLLFGVAKGYFYGRFSDIRIRSVPIFGSSLLATESLAKVHHVFSQRFFGLFLLFKQIISARNTLDLSDHFRNLSLVRQFFDCFRRNHNILPCDYNFYPLLIIPNMALKNLRKVIHCFR